MEIYTNTLAEAHEAAFDAILNRHKEIYIQTHVDKEEFTLEFEDADGNPDEIKIRIKHPLEEPQISDGSKYGPLFTEAYKKQFLTLSPPRVDGKQATYTYWNRLKDFPHIENAMKWLGDGKGDGYDQMMETIKKLADDPNSRRGVMVTWNPLIDTKSLEPPCMNWLQVVIRNGKVHLRVLFRSQDILLGLPENLVGCSALLQWIVSELQKLGLKVVAGILVLISTIPHIYKKRDAEDFDKMKNHILELKSLDSLHIKKWNPRVVE